MENYSIKADPHPAGRAVTFSLNGRFDKEALAELKHSIDAARSLQQQVIVDLSEVTLVDRKTAEYLCKKTVGGIQVINCPVYLSRWIQGGMK